MNDNDDLAQIQNVHNAYKRMQDHDMPFVWKFFFFFVKRGMALVVYLGLKSIRFFISRM